MSYHHTQKGRIPHILFAVVLAICPLAWIARDQPGVLICLAGVAVAMVLAGLMFHRLTIHDEGDFLALRYGPLPVFGKRIPYDGITSVEPGRSSVIDGWGIHWVPGRGTTYNLWGFDCAVLRVRGRIVRIGSDDVENLVAFLRGKIEARGETPGDRG